MYEDMSASFLLSLLLDFMVRPFTQLRKMSDEVLFMFPIIISILHGTSTITHLSKSLRSSQALNLSSHHLYEFYNSTAV